jgi:hypothetical protein
MGILRFDLGNGQVIVGLAGTVGETPKRKALTLQTVEGPAGVPGTPAPRSVLPPGGLWEAPNGAVVLTFKDDAAIDRLIDSLHTLKQEPVR